MEEYELTNTNMRAIKFRAFSLKDRVMRFFGLFEIPDWAMHKHSEPMQFTGLTDKNGVEIYEGDIINWWHASNGVQGESGPVAWDAELAAFVHGDPYKTLSMYLGGTSAIMEVVGNVHENPELLESR